MLLHCAPLERRKLVARQSQRYRANVANLSQRVARMSQSRRATVAKASRERRKPVATCRAYVAKASRDIPAMPFSATIRKRKLDEARSAKRERKRREGKREAQSALLTYHKMQLHKSLYNTHCSIIMQTQSR